MGFRQLISWPACLSVRFHIIVSILTATRGIFSFGVYFLVFSSGFCNTG